MPTELSKRFWETSRGRVLAILRRGGRTVEEIAGDLGLTDNAVRAHIATLERDGLAVQQGSRRGPGAGKPATVYGIAPGVAERLSRAYAPILAGLVDELAGELEPDRIEALMLSVGRRLAGTLPRRGGPLEDRLQDATRILHELGSDAVVIADEAGFRVQGSGCPLSAAVSRRPETCRALQGLLGELIGAPVQLCCEQGSTPRCCFLVNTAA